MSENRAVTPSPDEVRGALERILGSEPFAQSGRLARLLRYLVERALAGEADQLKEYAVGVDVFDRGDGYDPRLDSIVRVEARRLRAKLDEYYQNGGAGERVQIVVPRGTYAPVFTLRADAPQPDKTARGRDSLRSRAAGITVVLLLLLGLAGTAALRWRTAVPSPVAISVAVLPFEQHSGATEDQRLATHLTDAVTSELARTGAVSVVSRTSARQFEGARTSLRAIAQALDADFVMESTLETADDRVKVTARLVKAETDRKVWAEVFEGTTDSVGDLAVRVARAAAAATRGR